MADKFLKEKNLKLGKNIFADFTWQFENYLPSLYNINTAIIEGSKMKIQRYNPTNLYDIIINLEIKSNLKAPVPQCFPSDK